MKNNEKLKRVIEQDINLKNYYNEIISQIDKGEKMKNRRNTWKWAFVPICLVVLIGGVLFLSFQNNNKTILKNKPYIDEENNVTLNINEIDSNKVGVPRLDADVKIANSNDVNFPLPYIKGIVNIPKDLDKTNMYIFYTRENKDSKDYNILNSYEVIYGNDDRSINVKYSKEHKPLRDYYFSEEESKVTTINGIELKIYKFENMYFTEFKFNNYNFDIETSNITEQEFSSFLLSVLK